MALIKTACNQCGTALEADEHSKFINCNTCGENLRIIKTPNSIYTLEVNQEPTLHLESTVSNGNSEVYAQVTVLDSEWKNRIPNYMIRGTLPNKTTNGLLIIALVISILIAIFFLILLLLPAPPVDYAVPPTNTSRPYGAFLSFIMLITAIAYFLRRGLHYLKEKKAYEAKRKSLLEQIK